MAKKDEYLLLPVVPGEKTEVHVEEAENPLPRGTLGDIGVAARVKAPSTFPQSILTLPFNRSHTAGVNLATVRLFRWSDTVRSLRPIWNSGVNDAFSFVWARITHPGLYVAIGLPLDPLLQEALTTMARMRAYADAQDLERDHAITRSVLDLLLAAPEREIEEFRRLLAMQLLQTASRRFTEEQLARGRHGGHVKGFRLPGGVTFESLKKRLAQLETPPGGLPEEALLLVPEFMRSPVERLPLQPMFDPEPEPLPWPRPPLPDPFPWPWPVPLPWPLPWPPIPRLPRPFPWPLPLPWPWFCWIRSRNWWMYHHDAQHSGHASGCSNITSTSVGGLTLRHTIPVDGTIWSIPTVVDGKIYVGTIKSSGGTLYKHDLATGAFEHMFAVGSRMPAYSQGIGGSPAVVAGKVYFTALPGWVYCLDANTFGLLWVTDLRNADPAHNQPVQNISWTDSWTSPLVVNGRVYVGCGEGEGGAFGFVYCLDAATGNVVWLFCTNKFTAAADNAPNVIPASAVGVSPLPASFTSHADPLNAGGAGVGVSIWSSLAWDSILNRVYVGTGNSQFGDDNPLPDAYYGSGMLALDASTGAFRGFFQPAAGDSYRPTDTDVDICGSPTVFTRGGTRVVGIGSKNGSYFLLDASTLAVLARRQLLPYQNNNPANPLPAVDPGAAGHLGENMYGIFGTGAVDYARTRLFVAIGGYGSAIDTASTPFMRALDWMTLNDVWLTTVGADGVTRYTVPQPPMYTNPGESGVSSPAVVNDVVFVSTTKPGLYALDAATGLCLWPASGLTPTDYILGPAIYGDNVVVGSGNTILVYSL